MAPLTLIVLLIGLLADTTSLLSLKDTRRIQQILQRRAVDADILPEITWSLSLIPGETHSSARISSESIPENSSPKVLAYKRMLEGRFYDSELLLHNEERRLLEERTLLLRLRSKNSLVKGDYELAADLIEAALAQDPKSLQLSREAAYIQMEAGRYPRASKTIAAGIELAEASTRSTELALTLLLGSEIERNLGNLSAADNYIDRAERIFKASNPTQLEVQFRIGVERARTALAIGDYTEASNLVEELLRPRDLLLLQERRVAAAQILRQLGEYEQAEELTRKVIAAGSPQDVSSQLNSCTAKVTLANIKGARNKNSEGLDLLDECIEVRGRILGIEHPLTGDLYTLKASFLNALGKPLRARELLAKAEKVTIASYGKESLDHAFILDLQAGNLHITEDLELALELQTRARQIFEENLAPQHSALVFAKLSQAQLLFELNRIDDSRRIVREAAESLKGRRHNPALRGSALIAYANNLTLTDNLKETSEAFEKAIEALEEVKPYRQEELATAHNDFGYYLFTHGRFLDASDQLQKALLLYKQELGESHPFLMFPLGTLGMVNLHLADGDDCEPYFRQALNLAEMIASDQTGRRSINAKQNLAFCLSAKKNLQEARHLMEEVVLWRRAEPTTRREELVTSLSNLGRVSLLTDDKGTARKLFSETCEEMESSGELPGRTLVLCPMGWAYFGLRAHDFSLVRKSLREASEVLGNEQGNRRLRLRQELPLLEVEAELAWREGDIERAIEKYEELVSTGMTLLGKEARKVRGWQYDLATLNSLEHRPVPREPR